jgi:hypothetical protein
LEADRSETIAALIKPFVLPKNLRVFDEFSTDFWGGCFVSACGLWRKIFYFFGSARVKTCAFFRFSLQVYPPLAEWRG